ncbi:MAG TPA: hypothetical protein GX513_05885 [Firmicutes bacterium]|nr:hypothetical protein [Bacillota bacterium]
MGYEGKEAQDGGARVGDLGEFALIERLRQRLAPARVDVVVGIGDDVAVMAVAPDRYLLATCDTQVAGVISYPTRWIPTVWAGRRPPST